MENTEIWKPCEEADGLLEVSSLGRIRTVERVTPTYGRMRNGVAQGAFTQRRPAKMLSPYIARSGYPEIAFMLHGKRTKYRVHRLVGKAFVEGFFPGATIDHLDGDKTNNRAANLQWVTLSENTRRQWGAGLVDLRGELHPGSKLTNTQAHAIAVLHENKFPVSQVAEWFGVSTSLVYKIAAGRRATS